MSRYSRPAYAQNESFEDETQDLMAMDPASNLSLNFAMPPVAQVRSPSKSMGEIYTPAS